MSDTITKAEEMGYFNEEWNKVSPKINNSLTPLQAQNILTFCISAAGEDKNLVEDIKTLKKYLKSKL